PPPTGHRFSLALPFVAIVMALPLRLLLERRWAPATVRAALVAGLLFLYASLNERRLVGAVIRDASPDELRLSELLNQRFGPRHLYVAAFDAFFFEKVFYFQDRWKGLRRVDTKFHSYLLENFRRGEKYVYVMILGDAFRRQFEKADPAGRYTRFSVGYSLFFNRFSCGRPSRRFRRAIGPPAPLPASMSGPGFRSRISRSLNGLASRSASTPGNPGSSRGLRPGPRWGSGRRGRRGSDTSIRSAAGRSAPG